jgi:hypothetical protein
MAQNGKRLGFMPGWRIFTYVILLFNLIMLIWIISGVASSGTPKDCGGLDVKTCTDASNVGTAIGAGLIIVLWALGDVILGVLWLVTNRKKTRPCPVCGSDVKKGVLSCRQCGYDFRAGAMPSPQPYPPAPR